MKDAWSPENLKKMRHVGDDEGDALAEDILARITPEAVETSLDALLQELGVDAGGSAVRSPVRDVFEGRIKDRRAESQEVQSVRWKLEKGSEFHAGTFRVLDGLKVAGAALRAAEVAYEYEDLDSADRFREQAIVAIQNAKVELGLAREQYDGDNNTRTAVPQLRWFTPELKRTAYNDLLGVAEYLATAPDLLSAPHSAAAQRFDAYPSGFKDYFGPTPAPDWVDEELLEKASKVWDENTLFILLTLFSGSLPYCYLDRRGIPLLYETGKLTCKSYISQRLYETGLMLNAVMSRGGIRVDHDLARQHQNVARAAAGDPTITEIHVTHTPAGGQTWTVGGDRQGTTDGGPLTSPGGGAGTPGAASARFLSGPGVLYAKKVRLLHAAMRHMALRDDPDAKNERGLLGRFAQGEWDDANGVPINQEDLAYTLLTFSYVIPTGLATWGRRPDRSELRAFLHCWKVTGYLMGIREDLLTDDPDEAKQLFDSLVKSWQDEDPPKRPTAQDTGCPDGDEYDPSVETSVKMTWAISDFLNRYLPRLLHGLPAVMIEDQVGRKNAKILLGSRYRWRPFTRTFFWVVTTTSKLHGLMNRLVYSRIPLVQTFFDGLMREVGVAFIESWRDPFERRPFMLPAGLQGWTLKPGVTDHFMQELDRWRRRLFALLALGLMLMIGGSVAIVFGIVLSVLNGGRDQFELGLLVGIPLFILASLFMQIMVSRTAQRRPVLDRPITLVRKADQGST